MKLSRDDKGVLVAEFHSDGGRFVMTSQSHTEFVDAFHRVGLGPRRHSFDGEEGGNEVDRGGVAGVGLVVPGGDTAEPFDPLEEVLARKSSLSNALSAMRASKSTPFMSGSTPTLS